jgi:hypothetical protein
MTHPERDAMQVAAVLLEPIGQPVDIAHPLFPSARSAYKADEPQQADVTPDRPGRALPAMVRYPVGPVEPEKEGAIR